MSKRKKKGRGPTCALCLGGRCILAVVKAVEPGWISRVFLATGVLLEVGKSALCRRCSNIHGMVVDWSSDGSPKKPS
jgi:hypothetical protein